MDINGAILGMATVLLVGGLLVGAGAVNRWRHRIPRRSAAGLVLALVPGAALLVLGSWLLKAPSPSAYSDLFLQELATACATSHGTTAARPADVVRLDDGVTGSAPRLFFYLASRPLYVVDVDGAGGESWTCRVRVSNGSDSRIYKVVV